MRSVRPWCRAANAVLVLALTALGPAGQQVAALDDPPAERCALPGTDCRPDGPWPLTRCNLLLNATACNAAHGTPQCDSEGCATFPRCAWNGSACEVPPTLPPQPCEDITHAADCRWSLGRDCRWTDAGKCVAVPPAEELPLPACASDHTCAHNGMSDVPPVRFRPAFRRSNTRVILVGCTNAWCVCARACSDGLAELEPFRRQERRQHNAGNDARFRRQEPIGRRQTDLFGGDWVSQRWHG